MLQRERHDTARHFWQNVGCAPDKRSNKSALCCSTEWVVDNRILMLSDAVFVVMSSSYSATRRQHLVETLVKSIEMGWTSKLHSVCIVNIYLMYK